MLNHILVALDTVTNADYILSHAIGIARAVGARLMLVHLLDETSHRKQFSMVDPLDWRLRKLEAQATLDTLAENLRRTELQVETALLESADVASLLQFAQAHQVDLIVLTKQSEVVNDFIHGITKVATMPILILQPRGYLLNDTREDQCFQKILIPLDGSQRAEYALPVAASLACHCEAQLLVAHVVHRMEVFRQVPPPSLENAEMAENVARSHWNEAVKYLEQLAARLPGDVQTRLLINDNVTTTLHQLVRDEGVDLIVLSAHGHSGEQWRPYGSIASSFITYSAKPVLLLQDIPLNWKELRGEPVAVRTVR